jgi:hypothetical protein
MVYTFTLTYRLGERDPDRLVELLGVTGWSDALVGIGVPGRLAVEFSRKAKTARAAMRSALADLKRAVPSGRLVEVMPDFVGLTDVAEIVGVSRQNLRILMLRHHDTFPVPVHEGKAAIWHLAEVLGWLEDEAGYAIDRRLREVAHAAMEVNLVRDVRRLRATPARELGRLVG